MFGNKIKVPMTEDEKTILILALNELRNKLISENTYTDAVDELILEIISIWDRMLSFSLK